jgi:hypothetical protein
VSVSVHLAVNDRNGNKTGRVEAIQIFDDTDPVDPLISLIQHFDVARCFIYGNCLEIEGHRWPIRWHGSYVGSIIYDAVGMREEEARRMVSKLLRHEGWTADQFFDDGKWDAVSIMLEENEHNPFTDPAQTSLQLEEVGR